MKCILHIGTEKTGSSVLQHWLYHNRENLSKQGVYLSERMGMPINANFVSYFLDYLDDWAYRLNITTLEQKDRFFKDFEPFIAEEIQQAEKTHDTMIITSELFHSRYIKRELIEKLKVFLDKYFDEVEVVCYFREQSAMRLSFYNTMMLVVGEKGDINDFDKEQLEQNHYYNFYKVANDWATVFGKENCCFKIYERNRFYQKDIRKDFIHIFKPKFDFEALDYNLKSANSSFSAVQLELFRLINNKVDIWNDGMLGTNMENLYLKQLVVDSDLLNVGKTYYPNSEETFDSFYDSNEQFFNEFFDGKFLFKKPKDKADPNAKKQFTTYDVQNMLVQLMNKVMDHYIPKTLADNDADILRNIALKFESKQAVSQEEAYELMRLANKARPNGPLIKQKLEEYKKK